MGASTFESTVLGVETRQVKRKRDNAMITIYEVIAADGSKWSTAQQATAQAAHALFQKPAIWHVKIEQNGNFENRYLQAISGKPNSAIASTMEGAIQAHAAAMPNAITTIPAPAVTSFPNTVGGTTVGTTLSAPSGPSEKDLMIFRQTATKVAAHLAKTPEEFWASVDSLVKFYETGLKPHEQALKNGINNVPAPEDDDIPF